jgi:hypothetical protein
VRDARDALGMAEQAQGRDLMVDARIETHEAACAERWKKITEALDQLSSNLRRPHWCQLRMAVSVAGAPIGARNCDCQAKMRALEAML